MDYLTDYLSEEEICQAISAPEGSDRVIESLLYQMCLALRAAAIERVKENNTEDEYEVDRLISRCDYAIREISSAFHAFDWNNEFEPTASPYDFFNPHASNTRWVLNEKRKLMKVGRGQLEQGVEAYLELPVRSTFIDKLLLQMLVATEIHGYAANVSATRLIQLFGRKRNNILLKGRLGMFGEAIKQFLFSIIIFVAIGIGIGLMTLVWQPFAWLFVLLALVVLWDVGAHLFGIVRALFLDMKQFERTWAAMGRVEIALSTQHESRDTLRHFRKLVEDAENANVVWPNALHPLLEDMEERGVTRV